MSIKLESDVISVVESALELKPGQLGAESKAEEIDKWDSLGQLSILVALDKLFDGGIANITEMAEADSMPRILAILRQHALL
jgi:acyl carrier protein